MFAVLKTGGKQYKVSEGDVFKVERLPYEVGGVVHFDDILLVSSGDVGLKIGSPTVEGASISAKLIDHVLGDKVISFKKRRRNASSQRKKGHRQKLSVIEIVNIIGGKS